MNRLVVLAIAGAAAVCVSACDGLVVVISTGPSSVAGARVDGGAIPIGTPVTGMLTAHGSAVQYQVVAPRSGTLALGVNWDRSHGLVDVLFASNMLPRPLNAPPINARVPVQSGQSYSVQVVDAGSTTGEPVNLPFTVTATLE
jgi:hypothetical protein